MQYAFYDLTECREFQVNTGRDFQNHMMWQIYKARKSENLLPLQKKSPDATYCARCQTKPLLCFLTD